MPPDALRLSGLRVLSGAHQQGGYPQVDPPYGWGSASAACASSHSRNTRTL